MNTVNQIRVCIDSRDDSSSSTNIEESVEIRTEYLPRVGDTLHLSNEMKCKLEDAMYKNWKKYPSCVWGSLPQPELIRRLNNHEDIVIERGQFYISDYMSTVSEVIFSFIDGVIWVVLSSKIDPIEDVRDKLNILVRKQKQMTESGW